MPKILYIEDTENNRILISRRLGQSGYQVLTAETAERGLAIARAEKPDLILMDMGLPEVDGWSATRQLKEDPELNRIPIIALTAHVMHGDREKALAAGCDEYDTKPFQFVRLLNKISNLLASAGSGSHAPAASEKLPTLSTAEFKDLLDEARHDLCNPLGNILGFCEILLQPDQPPRSPEVKLGLKTIDENASRMVRALKQTLKADPRLPSSDEIKAMKAQLHGLASKILATNRMLLQKAASLKDHPLREDLSRMLESAERVAKLIDSIPIG